MDPFLDFLKNGHKWRFANALALWICLPVFLWIVGWDEGKPYVWVLLLVTAYLVSAFIDWAKRRFIENKKMMEKDIALRERLEALSVAEKEILKVCFKTKFDITLLDERDPAVIQLCEGRILKKHPVEAQYTVIGVRHCFSVLPDAWEYLNVNRHLLL